MEKRSIKFEINFTNKWLYTFIALGVVLVLTLGVFAYNSGKAPNVMGHSGDEIMVSFKGQDVTLNSALVSISSGGSFGGGVHHSSGFIMNDQVVSVPQGFSKSECSFLVSSGKKISSSGSYNRDGFVSVEFLEVSNGWKVLTGEYDEQDNRVDYGDYNKAYWILICS